MAYGTYDRQVVDSSNDDHGRATAIALEAAAGAILTKTIVEPVSIDRFGFQPTVLFNYDTQVTKGVLTLYKYPFGVSGSKVALATINLEDGDLAKYTYFCDVDNKVVEATSPATGVASKGIADLEPGDQVVVEISTQAVGGVYIAGDFQPFVCMHRRAESTENLNYAVDRTPAKTPVSSPY